MRRSLKYPALLLAGALVVAGCGSNKKDTASSDNSGSSGSSSSGSTGKDGVKMGPGVTDSDITLGVLTDLTGPFKDFSTNLQVGHKMWTDEVNAKGGVCGRQIKLETLDHGYK